METFVKGDLVKFTDKYHQKQIGKFVERKKQIDGYTGSYLVEALPFLDIGSDRIVECIVPFGFLEKINDDDFQELAEIAESYLKEKGLPVCDYNMDQFFGFTMQFLDQEELDHADFEYNEEMKEVLDT